MVVIPLWRSLFRYTASTALCAVLGSPAVAAPIDYAFTGIVTNESGTFGPIANGTSVSGTYTFDSGQAISGQTVPAALWSFVANSGAANSLSPSPLDFSSSIAAGSSRYETSPLNAYLNQSEFFAGTDGHFYAAEQVASSGVTGAGSTLYLYAASSQPAYTSGPDTPQLVNGGTGSFYTNVGGAHSELDFSIQSFTPVPLPAAAWLLLSGLAGMSLSTHRRKAT